MSVQETQKEIFRKGSKTYFNSSIFFPQSVRRDVFVLYAFVRTADDFVDEIPQNPEGFYRFREEYRKAVEGEKSGNQVIDPFVELMKKRSFSPQWVEAFLGSMEMDLSAATYPGLKDTLRYIYGSAEVIGLFMARIMELPEESHHAARMLGRAMQYINFIRDIDEDNGLGRTYLPLAGATLESLNKDYVTGRVEEFARYIRRQIELYRGWQNEAEAGFHFIPKRYLIPIKTASDMYNWTAAQIEKEPMVVFKRKVKPTKPRIMLTILKNSSRCR